MKKLFYLSIAFIGLLSQKTLVYAQGVGINPSGNNPDPSALLDLSSTTKGSLIPRMTTVQRDAITNPAQALQIYNITTKCFEVWENGLWQSVWCAACPPPAQPSAISGNASPCVGTSQSYSVTNVSGVTYTWTFPAGWAQTAGGTTNSVTVTVGAGSGNVQVVPSNVYCGNGTAQTLTVTPIATSSAPSAGIHSPSETQIVWNWNTVSGATGYKYNTVNNYSTATDNTTSTSYTQNGLTCNTSYTLYVWAYNSCGNSSSTTLTQTTSACCINGTLNPSFGSGGVITEDLYSDRNEVITAMTLDATGVYVAGYDQHAINSSLGRWRIEKRDLITGAVIWTQTEDPSSGDDRIQAIALNATGVYVAGYDGSSNNDKKWRIEKRNLSTGALISTFGSGGVITEDLSTSNDIIYAIALDATGLYVAGYDRVLGSSNGRWRIEKRDLSTGALITSFGSSGIITENISIYDDIIYGIALDATGVYLAGYDEGATGSEWRIEKRDLSTGAIIWTRVENIPPGDPVIYAITLDATGIYVAGTDKVPGNFEWRIEKRDLSTGAIIWTQIENLTFGDEKILTIALDVTGVYVAGYDMVPGSREWKIEKRNLGTGAIIWTQTSDPSTTDDEVYSIALDATGIYMAGYDNVPVTNSQWRIEKRCK